MKKILMICAVFFVCGNTYAQTESASFYNPKADAGNNDNAPSLKSNEFDNVGIVTEQGHIAFSGLPEEKKSICAMVTNPAGEFVKQMKVTSANNIMDISKLHSGMYFVTLIYRNESKKGFVIHI